MSRPNRKQWRLYDLVIHANDAKEHRMLRRVIGFRRAAGMLLAVTDYAFPNELPEDWQQRTRCDRMDFLHDPRRYGLSATQSTHMEVRHDIFA